jgi:hypothetical protein
MLNAVVFVDSSTATSSSYAAEVCLALAFEIHHTTPAGQLDTLLAQPNNSTPAPVAAAATRRARTPAPASISSPTRDGRVRGQRVGHRESPGPSPFIAYDLRHFESATGSRVAGARRERERADVILEKYLERPLIPRSAWSWRSGGSADGPHHASFPPPHWRLLHRRYFPPAPVPPLPLTPTPARSLLIPLLQTTGSPTTPPTVELTLSTSLRPTRKAWRGGGRSPGD